MSSRGVVFGDMMRGDSAWNERLRATLEPRGVAEGEIGTIEAETSAFLHADLWAEDDGAQVIRAHVRSYFGVSDTASTFFELAYGACAHIAAVGVLAERQRWGGDAGLSVREAKLEAALREILANGGSGCCDIARAALK